jgi:hypothetical protein
VDYVCRHLGVTEVDAVDVGVVDVDAVEFGVADVGIVAVGVVVVAMWILVFCSMV